MGIKNLYRSLFQPKPIKLDPLAVFPVPEGYKVECNLFDEMSRHWIITRDDGMSISCFEYKSNYFQYDFNYETALIKDNVLMEDTLRIHNDRLFWKAHIYDFIHKVQPLEYYREVA